MKKKRKRKWMKNNEAKVILACKCCAMTTRIVQAVTKGGKAENSFTFLLLVVQE